ncbi:glycoside hydrolase superfamily [Halenospora varia]|nr:glycoside hydrolase superfamily [Halenospora varia]
MFSTSSFVAATAALSLIATSSATESFNPTGNSNVAVYWGQGSNQQRLRTFCDATSIDIIPIGFLTLFPAQGNGFPEENFGNACWGGSYYYGTGSDHANDKLVTQCPTLQEDIPYCQSIGKKIILSLGGESLGYDLNGAAAGTAFADWLWGAYGPPNSSWTGIRPLDRGYSNTTTDTIDIDGFDFDIEHAASDGNSAGYIALINQLRLRFKESSKPRLITGAPQCFLPEANMGAMIQAAQFDILWIQFYNNPSCSARTWANNNANYAKTGVEYPIESFNYDTWVNTILPGGNSSAAKIYIGLEAMPRSGLCTPADVGTNYVNGSEVKNLISAYQKRPHFGGVMLWDATFAINNPCECGPYYDVVKTALNGVTPPALPSKCVISSTVSSTTSKPTSSSSSSSSSTTKVTTTSSSSTSKVSSTSSTATSTPKSSSSSSSTSKPTTTSKTSTSSSVSSTSTVKLLWKGMLVKLIKHLNLKGHLQLIKLQQLGCFEHLKASI